MEIREELQVQKNSWYEELLNDSSNNSQNKSRTILPEKNCSSDLKIRLGCYFSKCQIFVVCFCVFFTRLLCLSSTSFFLSFIFSFFFFFLTRRLRQFVYPDHTEAGSLIFFYVPRCGQFCTARTYVNFLEIVVSLLWDVDDENLARSALWTPAVRKL